MPIYFCNQPERAAFYARDRKDPVLLELASPGPAKLDTLFSEWYFPSHGLHPQRVHIIRAWEVSKDHIDFLQHHDKYPSLSLNQKFITSAKETLKALKETQK